MSILDQNENKNVYVKLNVKKHEYDMHKHIYDFNIVNVPKIISYDLHNRILTMEKIENMNIADMYGEDAANLDEYYFDQIRTIIKKLALNNIEYPDITGYNFIEHDNKIWIIDFEHSKFIKDKMEDPFVSKFIYGLNKWNPRFK